MNSALDRAPAHPHTRFVNHDMFMRYRGGGIGHKYMREVEMKYENMSLKRSHGNSHPKPPDSDNAGTNNAMSGGESAADGLNPGGTNEDDSGSDNEDHAPPRKSSVDTEDHDGNPTHHNEASSDTDENAADHDHNEDSDDDSGSIDLNADFDEVGSEDGYESFGLADL